MFLKYFITCLLVCFQVNQCKPFASWFISKRLNTATLKVGLLASCLEKILQVVFYQSKTLCKRQKTSAICSLIKKSIYNWFASAAQVAKKHFRAEIIFGRKLSQNLKVDFVLLLQHIWVALCLPGEILTTRKT